MTALDRKRLSGGIAGRYGVRIDENDPAFIVASLSERAFEAASTELMQRIDASLKAFEAVVERTQTRAGKHLGAECREQVTAIRSQLEGDIWRNKSNGTDGTGATGEYAGGLDSVDQHGRFFGPFAIRSRRLGGGLLPMSRNGSVADALSTGLTPSDELPLTVRDAATYLGVSPQTVYLWVERKQIPHLRDGSKHAAPQIGSPTLPRNLQTGGGNCQDRVNTMAPYTHARTARLYGWSIETGTENGSGNQRTLMTGRKRSENCAKLPSKPSIPFHGFSVFPITWGVCFSLNGQPQWLFSMDF
jgi:excisionase family DNA binding protein